MKNDAIRQKALEETGFTVLRFTNEEVLENINAVYSFLEDWIEKKVGKQFLRHTKIKLCISPAGGGRMVEPHALSNGGGIDATFKVHPHFEQGL